MKLIGLVRVSTDEQAGDEGQGLERQRHSLKGIAKAHGADLQIVEVVNVSGSDVADCREWRDVILPALADPDTHLAVDEIKRLIRADAFDLRVLQDLKRLEKSIFSPGMNYNTQDPQSVMMLTMFAGLGGYDKAEIKRQMQHGKESKRRRGKWVSRLDALPMGITYDRKAEVWGYSDDAAKVKAMFMAASEGKTFATIGRAHGMPIPSVKIILTNAIYDGRLRFDQKRGAKYAPKPNGKQTDRRKVARPDDQVIDVRIFSEDDQLVPHDLWLAVQARIRQSQAQHRKARDQVSPHIWASTYLYSGHEPLAMDMGQPFQHVIYGKGTGLPISKQGKPTAKVPRYLCSCTTGRTSQTLAKCGLHGFQADTINLALDRYLANLTTEAWFLKAATAALSAATAPDLQADKDRIAKGLTALDRRDRKMLDLYEADELDRDELTRRRDVIKNERRALQADLARLEAVPELPSQEALEAQARTWGFDPTWEPSRKRDWLAKYILKIRITNTGILDAHVRISGDNGSQIVFGIGDPASWESLLGQHPRGMAAQATAKGSVTTEGAAGRLGLTVARLQALLRDGTLPDLADKVGGKRVWSAQDIEATRIAIEALKAGTSDRVYAAELGNLIGMNREQVRYAETLGKLPKALRDDQGRRYWLRADVALVTLS